MKLQLRVRDKCASSDEEWHYISDWLYWFEENFVTELPNDNYDVQQFIGGVWVDLE